MRTVLSHAPPTAELPDGLVAKTLLRCRGGVVAEIDALIVGFWRTSFDLAIARDLRALLADACARRGSIVLLTGFQTGEMDLRAFADERVRSELSALAHEV